MNSLLLQPLEQAINGYLALDPESAKRLQPLEGKTITIEIAVFQFCFQMTVEKSRIKLTPDELLTAEIKIRGTPLNLMALALSRKKKQAFFKDSVVLEGNADLGMEIMEIFNQMEIDWEEHLSRIIGDMPANQLGRFTRNLFKWGKGAKESLTQNVNEYVHEEKLWFPPKEAMEDFYREVDELRLDLDRLEARVKHLQEE